MTNALLVTTSLMSTALSAAEWERLADLPEPNAGFVCGRDGERVIVIGGTHWEGGQKNWLCSVSEWSATSGQWSKAPELKSPLAYAVPLQWDDPETGESRLSFIGGTDGKSPVKAIGQWQRNGAVFQPLPELPDNVVLSAGAQWGSDILLVGGTNDPANLAGLSKSVYHLHPSKGSWETKLLPDFPGKATGIPAAALVGDSLYLFTGACWDASSSTVINTTAAHAFSFTSQSWRSLKPFPLAIRGLSAVLLDGRHIYLAGGYESSSEGFVATAFLYDVETDQYRSAVPLPYAAMVGLVRLGGFVYCVGGEDKPKSRTAAFHRIPVKTLLEP